MNKLERHNIDRDKVMLISSGDLKDIGKNEALIKEIKDAKVIVVTDKGVNDIASPTSVPSLKPSYISEPMIITAPYFSTDSGDFRAPSGQELRRQRRAKTRHLKKHGHW